MSELYDKTNNNVESVASYIDPLDLENYQSVVPNSIINPIIKTPESTKIKTESPKSKYTNLQKFAIVSFVIITIGILFLLTYFLIYLPLFSSSPLISKYENKSNFTNKDQYEDTNNDNYDIHYLVEQMIYKEFSPKDKKKYLNLSQPLKEQLMIDYLIDKI